MENKMDMGNKIFHGLAGGIPYWEKDTVIELSMIQLRQILMYGGIYSRNILKQLGIYYDDKNPVYNGDDFISVCLREFPNEEMYGENYGCDSAFFRYVRNKIGLVLTPDLKEEFRKDNYKKLPGERQIKEKISINKIIAISVGIEDLELQIDIEERIKKLCKEYGVEIPIVDNSGSLISSKKKFVLALIKK